MTFLTVTELEPKDHPSVKILEQALLYFGSELQKLRNGDTAWTTAEATGLDRYHILKTSKGTPLAVMIEDGEDHPPFGPIKHIGRFMWWNKDRITWGRWSSFDSLGAGADWLQMQVDQTFTTAIADIRLKLDQARAKETK